MIIETHYVDETELFIELYNKGESPQTICDTLNIGMTAYHKYRQANLEKLNRTKTCPTCNKKFSPRNPSQKFCTPYCRHISTLEKQRNNYNKTINTNGRTCPICGEPIPNEAHFNRVYCSLKCRRKANYTRHKL